MDVLDKYKKAWENQPESEKQISKQAIFKMTRAKSSSIVKWIFIIGLFELLLFILSYFFIDYEKAYDMYEEIGLKNFAIYTQVLSVIIFFYFLIKFFKNFRSISVTDSTKELMSKILETRKSVKTYVIVNLAIVSVIFLIVSIASFLKMPEDLTAQKLTIFSVIMVVIAAIVLGLIWCFYQLLYGFLLKKLNKNYKELSKLEH